MPEGKRAVAQGVSVGKVRLSKDYSCPLAQDLLKADPRLQLKSVLFGWESDEDDNVRIHGHRAFGEHVDQKAR
jgi:hypothetical protein